MSEEQKSIWTREWFPGISISPYLFRAKTLRIFLFTFVALVTLVAAFHAVVNWTGKRAWEKYQREHEVQGVQFGLLAYVPPEVPDDENFAMTPALAPLFDFIPGTQRWREPESRPRVFEISPQLPPRELKRRLEGEKIALIEVLEPSQSKLESSESGREIPSDWSRSEAAAAVLERLARHDTLFDEIRTASKRPYARFNISYMAENPWGILLPHLAAATALSRALALRASALLTLDKTGDAFDDLMLILYLVDAIKEEPFTISHLVRLSCLHAGMQVLWEGLAEQQWSDKELIELQAQLQRIDLLAGSMKALQAEWAGMSFDGFRVIWENLDAFLDFPDGDTLSGRLAEGILPRLLPRGWLYFEQINYSRLFQEHMLTGVDPVARRLYPQTINRNAATLRELDGSSLGALLRQRLLATLFLSRPVAILDGHGPIVIHQQTARMQSAIDQAITACALERYHMTHGAYPEDLDSLVPPFLETVRHDIIDGRPMRYRREGDRFILYSIGWNEEDNGGSPALRETDPGDWVWHYPQTRK